MDIGDLLFSITVSDSPYATGILESPLLCREGVNTCRELRGEIPGTTL